MHGGLTFINSELAGLMRAAILAGDDDCDSQQKLVKFRILVIFSRQLGYHFAKTQTMAGDPMHQNFLTFGASFFGGVVNQGNITPESHLVEMVLKEDSWYEPFCGDL